MPWAGTGQRSNSDRASSATWSMGWPQGNEPAQEFQADSPTSWASGTSRKPSPSTRNDAVACSGGRPGGQGPPLAGVLGQVGLGLDRVPDVDLNGRVGVDAVVVTP